MQFYACKGKPILIAFPSTNLCGNPLHPMIRLFLIEDETMFRELLSIHWNGSREFNLIGSHRSIRLALDDPRLQRAEVVIMDLLLEREASISSIRELRAIAKRARIAILTGTEDAGLLRRAVAAGVDGILHKRSSLAEIDGLIRRIAKGEHILSLPFSEPVDLIPESIPRPTLTRREEEILYLIARGRTSAQIAEQLFISRRTVEKHRENIAQKLGLKSMSEMVAWAIRHGFDGRATLEK